MSAEVAGLLDALAPFVRFCRIFDGPVPAGGSPLYAVREECLAAREAVRRYEETVTTGPSASVVLVFPRSGVEPEEIARWIEENFQRAGMVDEGPTAPPTDVRVSGGNPLVNARVVVRTTSGEDS